MSLIGSSSFSPEAFLESLEDFDRNLENDEILEQATLNNPFRFKDIYEVASRGLAAIARGFMVVVHFGVRSFVKVDSLHTAIKEGADWKAGLYISSGIEVNAKSRFGDTALTIAVLKGKTELVKALLKAGAEVDLQDGEGNTPLMLAACKGDAETMRVLLDSKANTKSLGKDGLSVINFAAKSGSIKAVQLLLDRGEEAYEGIFSASKEGHFDIVELLLQNTTSLDDDILLYSTQIAIFNSHSETFKALFEVFLEKGGNVNDIKLSDGSSLLNIAAIRGNTEIVKVLLQNKIDINHKDNAGKTALWHAAEAFTLKREIQSQNLDEYVEIFKLLLKEGGGIRNFLELDKEENHLNVFIIKAFHHLINTEEYRDLVEGLDDIEYFREFYSDLEKNITTFAHQKKVLAFGVLSHNLDNTLNERVQDLFNTKTRDIVLYTMASSDHNQALNLAHKRHFQNISRLSAHYDVVIRSIDDEASLEQVFKEVTKTQKALKYVFLRGHGSPTSIRFSESYALNSNNLNVLNLDNELFDNTVFVLESCRTGQKPRHSEHSIARSIASRTSSRVIAPMGSLSHLYFDLEEDGELRNFQYYKSFREVKVLDVPQAV